MPLKLLATADIHIGRRPTRLPTTEDARRCSAAAMWDTIIQTAITQKIDALILAGDIVESDNQYYEALGRLETGLKRLGEQGIHTYAVSGNHDFEVFPRIIESLDDDHFHLVGQGGIWESVHHLHEGEPVLQIDGWSFPSRYVESSPLDAYTLPRDASLPTLGILHGDVDVSNSRYAPITTRQLEETDTDLWIMGHVHDPKPLGQNKALYTGSPQALDPGEQGNHGPWLLHIGDDQKITREQLVLSRVHYDTVTVSLDGVDTLDEFDRALGEKTVSAVKDFATQPSPPEFAILRVVLDGATPLCGKLDAHTARITEDYERPVDSIVARIDKLTNQTRPEIDLTEVAGRQDPTGVLASTLLRLEAHDDDDDIRRLLQQSLDELHKAHRHPTFAELTDDIAPDLDAARQMLLREGLLLLETLRSQDGVS
jgi:DNA repair protein SbcD/Mre11